MRHISASDVRKDFAIVGKIKRWKSASILLKMRRISMSVVLGASHLGMSIKTHKV